MTTPLFTYTQKSAQQIRADYLRTVKNGLVLVKGIPNPNVSVGSDYDLKATAIGNELAVVQANAVIQADADMPDTAAGSGLDRWLTLLGLSRRGAIGSTGTVNLVLSASSSPVSGSQQLQDTAGLIYQVQVAGTYTNGAQVPIFAVDVGKATNHENGDVLTWVGNGPPFSAPTATVGTPNGTDGLTGGADSEVGNDEPPRARLLARLAAAAGGGNWSSFVAWAQQSSPAVQAAFVYPALGGPATVFFCVVANPQTTPPFTSTSKNRDINASVLAGTIVPYVQGFAPEHAFVAGATAQNQPVDVAIGLNLPSASTASPAGPGGGWLDGSPWPLPPGGNAPCIVTAVASPTQITVNAQTPPQAGISRIAWLSPNDWNLYTATVLTASGSSGAYVLTLDTPLPLIAVNNVIFPQSVNQANYVAAILGAFALMGPGEWANTGTAAIVRGFRHPTPAIAWPYSLGGVQLRALTNAGPEVQAASWISRSAITPTVGTITFPSLGVVTATAPSILVPRNIGFYPSTGL